MIHCYPKFTIAQFDVLGMRIRYICKIVKNHGSYGDQYLHYALIMNKKMIRKLCHLARKNTFMERYKEVAKVASTLHAREIVENVRLQ